MAEPKDMKIKTQFRIDPYLYKMVLDSSEESGRSMNAEILHLIEMGLKAKSFDSFSPEKNDLELFLYLTGEERSMIRELIKNVLKLRKLDGKS